MDERILAEHASVAPDQPMSGDGEGLFAGLRRAVAERLRHAGNGTLMAKVIGLRGMAMAVNLLTSLLTAAVLGPSGRGEQAVLVLAPTFLGGLSSLGLHGALIYNLKADPAHERELLGNGLLLALTTGSIAMIVGWIIEPYWLQQYSAHTILVGRILLLVTPLIVVGWTLGGAADAYGWFGLVNRVLYLQSLATLALLGVMALLHEMTPTTSAFAYILPTIAVVGYVFAQITSRVRPVFRLRWDLVRQLLRYSVRLAGVDILNTLSGYIDQLIIVAMLPASMVGIYAVALSSARMLNVVQDGISSVLFPSVAAGKIAVVVNEVATAFRHGTVLIVICALLLALVGPSFLLFAYGAKFAPAIVPFRILLLAVAVDSGARILYQIYTGTGRPELVTIFECSAVAVLVAIMVVLVPLLGTLGASLAVLCAAGFRLTVAVGAVPLLLKIHLPRLILAPSDLIRLKTIFSAQQEMAPEARAMQTRALETLP